MAEKDSKSRGGAAVQEAPAAPETIFVRLTPAFAEGIVLDADDAHPEGVAHIVRDHKTGERPVYEVGNTSFIQGKIREGVLEEVRSFGGVAWNDPDHPRHTAPDTGPGALRSAVFNPEQVTEIRRLFTLEMLGLSVDVETMRERLPVGQSRRERPSTQAAPRETSATQRPESAQALLDQGTADAGQPAPTSPTHTSPPSPGPTSATPGSAPEKTGPEKTGPEKAGK